MSEFTLYHPKGVKCFFTLPLTPSDEAIDAYINNVFLSVERALAAGFLVAEPVAEGAGGLERGEEIEPIEGYIIGKYTEAKTNNMEPCVWLYSSKEVLRWKLTTVYPEDFHLLPFTVGNPTWRMPTPPDAQQARAEKLLTKYPMDIVMRVKMKDGEPVTKSGEVVKEFARVHGYTGNPPGAAAGSLVAQQPVAGEPKPVASKPEAGGPCPECFAPAGNPHATKCSRRNK